MTQVLLCSSSKAVHPELEGCLKSLGYPASFVYTAEELRQQVVSNPKSIVVFQIEFLELLEDPFLLELEHQVAAPFVLVSGKELEFNVVQLRRSVKIEHIIASGQTATIGSLTKVLKEIVGYQEGHRLSVQDIRSSMHGDANKVVRTFLDNSNERWDCYKDLSASIAELPVFSGFDNIAATIASELITNAFYNGPRTEDDKVALYHSRRDEVVLRAPKKVEFSYWSSDEDFWLMVVDPFGTLRRSQLVAALHWAVTEKTAKLDQDGGAGLGLRMIADWASELYFGLCDKEATWIACKLKLTKRRKIFSQERASLHIYEIKGTVKEETTA